MTKKELYSWINSFNKKPGEFTEDEQFQIGLKHKDEIILGERDWAELALRLFGKDGKSGESYRKWVLNERYKKGLVNKNPKILDNKTIDEIDMNDVESSLIKQKEELFKEKTKVRDIYCAYRRGMRNDARIETMLECIKDSVGMLNSLPKVTYKKELTDSAKEAILVFSDLHIGVDCKNFYNTYNKEVAIKRVNKLVDDTIEYCRNNKVSRLTFLNLGDCIHGIIHTSARVEQEMNVIDQVMTASEIISSALNRLQEAAPEVIYRSVVDNHSRCLANKEDSLDAENLSRIIDWYIEERLKQTKIKFENDNLDLGLGMFKLLNGKKVCFSHGHQDNVNRSFESFVGATGEFIDYGIIGHYHESKMKSFQGFKIIVNGSICGTESYALGKRLFGQPKQLLLIFDKDNLITTEINLNVK